MHLKMEGGKFMIHDSPYLSKTIEYLAVIK